MLYNISQPSRCNLLVRRQISSLIPSVSPYLSSGNHSQRLFQKTIEGFDCKILPVTTATGSSENRQKRLNIRIELLAVGVIFTQSKQNRSEEKVSATINCIHVYKG